MFFDEWDDVMRVLVVGSLAYVFLVVTLRISGKRTLAKLNAFDLVVTVALGSTLATALLSSTVRLVEGAAAVALLVLLQFVVAFLSTRAPAVRRLVKSEPTLVLHDGRLLPERLASNRVTEGEVRQAVRSEGIGGLERVAAVIIETDGTLSVVPHSSLGSANALADVEEPASSRD